MKDQYTEEEFGGGFRNDDCEAPKNKAPKNKKNEAADTPREWDSIIKPNNKQENKQ